MTKTNTRSRIVSILLVLMMLLTMVPITAVTANAAEWTTVNSFEELYTAVKDKKEYIKLGRDISTSSLNSGVGVLKKDILIFRGENTVLDLNGNTLNLNSRLNDVYFFIYLEKASLTIKDSSPAKNGKISGSFGSTTGGHFYRSISVGDSSSLTLEGGTFSVNGSPYPTATNTIYCSNGSVTVKDGVTISQPEFFDKGYARDLDGVGYALITEDKSKAIIEGGTFDGSVKLTGYQDTNGSVQINGGTFKNVVQLMYAATENNPNPAVIVNDGTFEGNVYLQGWPWRTSLYMPHRLNGGTIYGSLDLCADDFITDKDKPEGNLNIALGLDKCFGYSAVSKHDGVFTGSNIHNAIDWKKVKAHPRIDYYMVLKGDKSNPIRIIGDAWGMKSVTLDGNPIDYFKDWKGTVERMDNSTAHTLKFEWYPLAQELKDAGYTYRANFDCYTVGSNTPTSSVPISATATEYSHTIPAGAAPSVYPFDLQLNLDKNGSSVGIMSNQHIVKLVVSEAPPEPPAPVAHSITITNTHGTANPTTAIAGETVTVKADDRTGYSQMFTQWYTKTAGVTFADVTKQETTFVMPDCDVQVYPGYQYVSFTKQPIPQISLEKGYGGKTSFAFSWDISEWELVDTETDQTVSSGDTPVKAGKLTDVTIPANTELGNKTYRIVVTTANGEQFKSNDFTVTWFEKMPAPLVEFNIPSGTKFLGELTVNVGYPDELNDGTLSPYVMRYTTNGVDPKNANLSDVEECHGSTDVKLTGTTTIKARTVLVGEGGNADTWGELCEATYTMIDKLDAPTVTPTSCSYSGSLPIIVTIQDVYNAEIQYTVKQHDGYLSGNDVAGPMLETGLPDTFCGKTTFSAKAIVYKDGGGAWESDEVTYTYTREYWANISNATISGKVNQAIDGTDVTITLDGEKFKDVAVGDDVSGWFTNLPAGLTAKVKDQTSYSRELVITISGTPTATSSAAITVTIPKDKLLANGTVDLTVLSNPNAYYSIALDADHQHDYSGQSYLYLDPGNHYQECKVGDGYNIQAHEFTPWTDNGNGTHSRHCTVCTMTDGSTYTETAEHTWVWVVDQEAALNQPGKQHEECTGCHAKRSENTEIPALRDYAVTVTGGTATVAAGTPITRAMEGVEVTVTAQVPDEKHFVKWVVKAGGITLANETSATTTFIMPANDVTIEAEIAENPVESYTLTVIKGTASVAAGTPITDKIAQNTVVTVTADAPETGKVFDKWVVLEGNVTLADATKATTTFTMPGNAVKLEATYKDAPPSHTHSYGTDWKYDDTNHWHECQCGDKADMAAHIASEWIVDTAATETADGTKHKECTVCKKVLETETIPATGSTHTHSYGTDWKYDDTNHWHECQCGDKADIATHSASKWIVDTAATETADGAKHKECTVCKKVLETATIPATGSTHTHSYGTDWKYDGTNHWHECECGDKADTAAHSFQWVIDKAATKEATGIKHEECTVCGAKRSENTVIDKLPDGGKTGTGDNNTDKPGKDDSTKSPQTGDSISLIGWLAALFVSGGVLTVLGVSRKKRKESDAE